MKYAIYRSENFDVRERGTYNYLLYSQYGIEPHILAEKEKMGTDIRNMQCLPGDDGAEHLIFGDKEDVSDYDIVQFTDGDLISSPELPEKLINSGTKVIAYCWTKPSFDQVRVKYGNKVSYILTYEMSFTNVDGFHPSRYAIIPPAVETDFFRFKQPRKDPTPLKIGWVGIIERAKGHQFIEKIVSELADSNHKIELNLYGREDETPLKHEAIKFHGVIGDREKAPAAFQNADIYCCTWNPFKPFHADAFWVTVIEALSTGLPIIAWRAGSVEEYIVEGQNGFSVTNIEGMRDAILKYYDNPELIWKHAYNSRIRALQRFSPEVVTAKTARFIRSI
jgi:glycosyltransferase involved in cell wall biosynthesis